MELVDHRKPAGAPRGGHRPSPPAGQPVILTVGSDCAIGKMTVALELRRAAVAAGLRAVFVPTGQTGIMIEGWGVAVDRVVSDFVNGTAEWLVEQAEEMGDWIFVEGQGSIDHPAYSAVTLGLVHGCAPHAMVLVHQPGRPGHHGWEGQDGLGSPIKSVPQNIAPLRDVRGGGGPRARGRAWPSTRRCLARTRPGRRSRGSPRRPACPWMTPIASGRSALFDALRSALEETDR